MQGESEEYWKGYDDFRDEIYSPESYIDGSQEKKDYLTGQSDSEYDKNEGFDAR